MIANLEQSWLDGKDLRAFTPEHDEIDGAVWVDTTTGLVCRIRFGKNAHGHNVVTGRERLTVPGVYVAPPPP